MHGQIGGERPHPVAIGGRGGGLGREGGLGLAPAATPATLGDVLDHPHADVGHVEHLPALGSDDLGPFQPGAAPGADLGKVGHHLVGIGHLGQVLSFGTWLLARPAPRRSPFSPVGRLGQPFG